MDNEQKILHDETTELFSVNNALYIKWNSLQKDYFNNAHLQDPDLNFKIEEAAKLFRFSLPPDINELFTSYEEASVYWTCETKLNVYLKDFFRLHYPFVNGIDQFKFIKDYYSKWLLIKSQEEKKYYASTAINFFEGRGSRNNFLNYILCGAIFTYDKQLNNYQKAVEFFSKSKEMIYSVKLNDHYRQELEYLINLFSGFASLIHKEDEIAKNSFLTALIIKPNGITAKFHLALLETKFNFLQSVEYLLKEILHFDSLRIKFAIDNQNIQMLNYFLNNPVICKVFFYKEFACLGEVLENLFSSIKESDTQVINGLNKKTETFKKLNEEKNFNPEVTRQISFIEKVTENSHWVNNILLLYTGERLNSKFISSIEEIIHEIKQKYYSEIGKNLSAIDNGIQEKSALINYLANEFEKTKIKIKNTLEQDIKSFETKIIKETGLWEERIKNLDAESKFNPKTAFKRIMTYNIILSFISCLMGGCAGYSSSTIKDVLELKNLFSAIVVSGFKWGLITFAIGFIISAAAAIYAFIEKANMRQSILQKISSLKNEKEFTMNELKKEAQKKEKKLTQNFNNEIDLNKKTIDDLIKEKEKKEKELKADAERLIKEEIKSLESLLK